MTSLTKRAEKLEKISAGIRFNIIKNSGENKIPHLGSCLSCTDILTALYFDIMNLDGDSKDVFILSKGHAAPAQYFVLAEKGIISFEEMADYGEDGSLFGEHPPAKGIKGIEAATGSLGHGLPIICGKALASKIKKDSRKFYAVLGDGECNEGSIWEAVLFAASQKLDNLTAIVDYNKWQATGRSDEVFPLAPFKAKFESFGWECIEVDGHNMAEILQALETKKKNGKPKAVIAHTVKGKGVSFMEDDNNWHYRTPKQEEIEESAKQLGIEV